MKPVKETESLDSKMLDSMRVLILATSGNYEHNKKFLPSSWKTVDVELTVARMQCRDPYKRFVACLLQGVKVLPLLRRYDVVLSTASMNGLFIAFLQSLFRIRKPRHVVIDISLPRLISPKKKILLIVTKIIFSSVSKVICFASKQAIFWNFSLGFGDKAVFVPLGIEKASPCRSRPEFSKYPYIFSAGSAGRDYDTLIKAVERITVDLVIVAGRDPMTGKVPISIPIPSNVKLKVEVSNEEYRLFLAKAMFVVVPLMDVPFVCGQSVVLDAMSMGKAVIGTKGLSTIDYITDGETGLLVEAGNVQEMRDKIAFLLSNPSKVKEMGGNAKKAIDTIFNQKIMSEKIGKVLENATSC